MQVLSNIPREAVGRQDAERDADAMLAEPENVAAPEPEPAVASQKPAATPAVKLTKAKMASPAAPAAPVNYEGKHFVTMPDAMVKTPKQDCGIDVNIEIHVCRTRNVYALMNDNGDTRPKVIDAVTRGVECKFKTALGYQDPLHNLEIQSEGEDVIVHKFKTQSTKVRPSALGGAYELCAVHICARIRLVACQCQA